jgi:hypothetical protein
MTFDINLLKPNEVSINLKLFKLYRFFHLCDLKNKTIFNCNVYHLAYYIISFVVGGIVIYGLMGYVTEKEDEVIITNDILIMYCCIVYYLCLVKIITLTYKTKNIWNLLNVIRMHFLTSTQCQKHIGILQKYRKKSIKITNYISILSFITTFLWILYPLVLMLLQKHDVYQLNQRFENIFNLRYPVTISFYNNNFGIFYIMEVSIIVILLYMHVVTEVFFISLCLTFIAQFEMIKRAYENVNGELNSENTNSKTI